MFLINSDWVLLFVRVVLGVVMIYYGWPKIKNLNANDFAKTGYKPGWLWGTIIASIEFIGGIAVFIGLLAEIAAFFFAVQMIVEMVWKIAKDRKSFADWSYGLQLLAICLVIIIFGPGFYSVLPLF